MNDTRHVAWAMTFVFVLAVLYAIVVLIDRNEEGLGGPSGMTAPPGAGWSAIA